MTDQTAAATPRERLTVGELVDVVIRGVKVLHPADPDADLDMLVEVPIPGAGRLPAAVAVPVSPVVEVTRVAPADWPPCPGDLWRGQGHLWFAFLTACRTDHWGALESPRLLLRPSTDSGSGLVEIRPEVLLAEYSPLDLVHREPVYVAAEGRWSDDQPGEPTGLLTAVGGPAAAEESGAGS